MQLPILQLESVGGVTRASLRNAVISKNASFGATLAFRASATSFVAERKGIIPEASVFSCVCCVDRRTCESVCLDSGRFPQPPSVSALLEEELLKSTGLISF